MVEKQGYIETAKLKLAFLKENPSFIRFFEKLKSNPTEICPELRKEGENCDEYSARIHFMEIQEIPFFGGSSGAFYPFEINERFFIESTQNEAISTNDILFLLDPEQNIEHLDNPNLIQILPLLFRTLAVTEFSRSYGLSEGEDGNPVYRRYEPRIELSLKPNERLIKIDLTKKKAQMLDEIGKFIDEELGIQKAAITIEDSIRKNHGIENTLKSAFDWKPDFSRDRKEGWEQLDVCPDAKKI